MSSPSGVVRLGIVAGLVGVVACGDDALTRRAAEDAMVLVTDGGVREIDGGAREIDGGVQVTDGGIQVTDGGVQVTDGGVRVTDGGVRVTDGGVREIDGGVREIDGGVRVTDGGVREIDGGVREIDGGVREIDGGVREIDGGVREVDAGRPTDAGAATCVASLDGLRQIGSALQVSQTLSGRQAIEPTVVHAGAQIAVVWTENVINRVQFQRVSSDGSMLIGSAEQVNPTGTLATRSRMVANGAEYGVVWQQAASSAPLSHAVYFTRFSTAGARLVAATMVSPATASVSRDPAVSTDGARYAVLWTSGVGDIWFAGVTPAAMIASPAINLTAGFSGLDLTPSVAWTGSEYGVAFRSNRDDPTNTLRYRMYFTRVSAAGAEIGQEQAVSDVHPAGGCCTGFDHQSLGFDGTNFGLAQPDPSGQSGLTRLGPAGQARGFTAGLSGNTVRWVNAAWTGAEWVVAWHGQGVWLRRVSAAGAPIGPAVQIANGQQNPSVAFNGTEVVTAYSGRTTGSNDLKIFLARHELCP